MNYEEFKIEVIKAVKQLYGEQVKVSVEKVWKNNGCSYDVRRRIEIGVNCILNSRLLPTRQCSHTDNCTVQEGKLQLPVALF